jgi:glycosyltransferase involved in cell wall biosynthesis
VNVTVTLEHRFDRTPDGAVWTEAMFAYPFWCRYLEVFDGVRAVARAREVPKAESGWIRADGERVSFCALPHYIGPAQYLPKAWRVRRVVRDAVVSSDAVILRAPGMASMVASKYLLPNERPFGMEVVGDPYDWFAPGNTRHPLRPFFRWWFSHELRRQCAKAWAVAYVTQKALQRRYPAATEAFNTHYSDVELSDTAFVPSPRSANVGSDPSTLITVASFNMLYKAQDVLVDAVALCVEQGLELRLVLIGGGAHLSEIKARAKKRKLGSRVRFLGQLPAGPAVRTQLDRADLFVLPSRTEGLPRAMIEAMARGLPCVGSTAGGIPELLLPEDMVPPADAAALSQKIREVVTDPERMARMSERNLKKAREYQEGILRERRIAFYQYLKERTAVQQGRMR